MRHSKTIVYSIVLLLLMNVVIPSLALTSSAFAAKSDNLQNTIVICTASGLQVITLGESDEEPQAPMPKNHCPLCLVGKTIADDFLETKGTITRVAFDGFVDSYQTCTSALNDFRPSLGTNPRAPPAVFSI